MQEEGKEERAGVRWVGQWDRRWVRYLAGVAIFKKTEKKMKLNGFCFVFAVEATSFHFCTFTCTNSAFRLPIFFLREKRKEGCV